ELVDGARPHPRVHALVAKVAAEVGAQSTGVGQPSQAQDDAGAAYLRRPVLVQEPDRRLRASLSRGGGALGRGHAVSIERPPASAGMTSMRSPTVLASAAPVRSNVRPVCCSKRTSNSDASSESRPISSSMVVAGSMDAGSIPLCLASASMTTVVISSGVTRSPRFRWLLRQARGAMAPKRPQAFQVNLSLLLLIGSPNSRHGSPETGSPYLGIGADLGRRIAREHRPAELSRMSRPAFPSPPFRLLPYVPYPTQRGFDYRNKEKEPLPGCSEGIRHVPEKHSMYSCAL